MNIIEAEMNEELDLLYEMWTNMSIEELEERGILSQKEMEKHEKELYEEYLEEMRLEARIDYEISAEGQLDMFRTKCENYINDYNSIINKSTYEEKIDKLLEDGIEIVNTAYKMKEELTYDDITLSEEDWFTDKDWDEPYNEYFEEVFNWVDKIHYKEYDAENLVVKYEDK